MAAMPSAPREYQIGWICALPIETAAARLMLDEKYEDLQEQDNLDTNIYTLGRVGAHNIVIASLGPPYGTTSAAAVAVNMIRTFSSSLRLGIFVGVGGGIPSQDHDIRLGDVVVSQPSGTCGGVVQYDMGKYHPGGGFERTGSLNAPPKILSRAVGVIQADALTGYHAFPEYVDAAVKINSTIQTNFGRPSPQHDRLFQAQYRHPRESRNCNDCLDGLKVERPPREEDTPQVHYGIIASGNAVIRDAEVRDKLRTDTNALCFEMEAAGLMSDFPCLVIRGVCDYADSHKNKLWQGYAALVAAAYAKELLGKVPSPRVSLETRLGDIYANLTKEVQDLRQDTAIVQRSIDLGRLETADGAAFDSYENRHNECLAGTRLELLRYVDGWATSPETACIFWLSGMAGTGKSTVSRTVARLFRDRGLLGASFFFKRGEESQASAKRLFPTLSQQLAASIPEMLPHVQRAIRDDPMISTKAMVEQFQALLLSPLREMQSTSAHSRVIVIDALDECEREDEVHLILRLLPRVEQSPSARIKFFITSRPDVVGGRDAAVETGGHQQHFLLHTIPEPIITRDIALYLNHHIFEIRHKWSERGHSLSSDWPGSGRLASLVKLSVPLFIFAATVCRMLNDPQWHPEATLTDILSRQYDHGGLNGTYLPVFDRILIGQGSQRKKDKLVNEYRGILGIIVVLAAPLCVPPLAVLVGINDANLKTRLHSLRSVISVPSNDTTPVQLFHKSLADFLFDADTRTKTPMWIDREQMHSTVTRKCIKIMQDNLAKNICQLSHAGAQRGDLGAQSVQYHLPSEVQYSCRHWVHHLKQSADVDTLLPKTMDFLKVHFLHWFEAMGTIGAAFEVVASIDDLRLLIENSQLPEHAGFLYDLRRFALVNRQVADIAPLQLYSSGLLFTPTGTMVQQLFGQNAHATFSLPKPDRSWREDILTLEGHSSAVLSIAMSPDGRTLASGSNALESAIKLWDLSTGQLQQTLKLDSSKNFASFQHLAFSPDGKSLASALGSSVQLWDSTTGELRWNVNKASYSSLPLAFSPDSQTLAVGIVKIVERSGVYNQVLYRPGAMVVELWNPCSKVNQKSLNCSRESHSLAFSANGKLLASGSHEDIELWDLASEQQPKLTLVGHSNIVDSLAFSPDEQALVSGSRDALIKVWNSTTGRLLRSLNGHTGFITAVACSSDSQQIVSSSNDKTIKLWSLPTGQLLHTFDGHAEEVTSLVLSSDSRMIASCSNDSTVKLWDSSSHRGRQSCQGHSGKVTTLVFSPDGTTLASGGQDAAVKLWSPVTGGLKQTILGHASQVKALAFSPDGRMLISAADGTGSGWLQDSFKAWDPATGALIRTMTGHERPIEALAFSPDGKLLATGSYYTIGLWDPRTGQLKQSLTHRTWVNSLAFSPDGRLMASAASDIRLWNHQHGEWMARTLQPDTECAVCLVFSPDSRLLAAGYDEKAQLWAAATGELLLSVDLGGYAHNLRFSLTRSCLLSNAGDVHIGQWYTPGTSLSAASQVDMTLENHTWVCLQGKKQLWLPSSYRAGSPISATKNGVVALGHHSGSVSFILCHV